MPPPNTHTLQAPHSPLGSPSAPCPYCPSPLRVPPMVPPCIQLFALTVACSPHGHPMQYVELLRKCGLGAQLRTAHERMADLFPLSEQLWMEWVNDELAQVAGVEDVARIQVRGSTSASSSLAWSVIRRHNCVPELAPAAQDLRCPLPCTGPFCPGIQGLLFGQPVVLLPRVSVHSAMQ